MKFDSLRLDALVRGATQGGAARPVLQRNVLNGMLKGFIDLVFEHEGRYYVADYKSNWLGADDIAYSVDAMRAAVLEHRYDLQYVLYVFALHRLLRVRLPGYDYERHVGGAVYLFLRGSQSNTQGVHFERPPRQLMDALDTLFRDGAEVAA
ncbi:MAG: PD-(D/E)XK nuclease family protein [Rhodocyclaceae bacterium]